MWPNQWEADTRNTKMAPAFHVKQRALNSFRPSGAPNPKKRPTKIYTLKTRKRRAPSAERRAPTSAWAWAWAWPGLFLSNLKRPVRARAGRAGKQPTRALEREMGSHVPIKQERADACVMLFLIFLCGLFRHTPPQPDEEFSTCRDTSPHYALRPILIDHPHRQPLLRGGHHPLCLYSVHTFAAGRPTRQGRPGGTASGSHGSHAAKGARTHRAPTLHHPTCMHPVAIRLVDEVRDEVADGHHARAALLRVHAHQRLELDLLGRNDVCMRHV